MCTHEQERTLLILIDQLLFLRHMQLELVILRRGSDLSFIIQHQDVRTTVCCRRWNADHSRHDDHSPHHRTGSLNIWPSSLQQR